MPIVEILPHVIQGQRFAFKNFDDIDALVEWQPSITFMCSEMEMKSNGLQDDDEFIAKLSGRSNATTGGGICIVGDLPRHYGSIVDVSEW